MTIEEQIKACIHCGMCLPACPTYLVSGNEGNSPRGRIYLINDLIQDQKHHSKLGDDKAIEYLDNCLSCYACETACPSGVEYASIIEYAREELGQSHYTKGFAGFLRYLAFRYLLPNRRLLLLAARFNQSFAWLINILAAFNKKLGIINKVKPELDSYQELKPGSIYKTSFNSDSASTVSLGLGCVMDTFYNQVHWDSIYLLNQFGYNVRISKSTCCGALASHSGEYKLGHELLDKFIATTKEELPLVFNSAGCGAYVKDHCELESFDIIELLTQAPINPIAVIASEHSERGDPVLEISYHPACHLNHRQHIAYDYLDLVKMIPDIKVQNLHQADVCCGSAGFYNIIKPEMADAIGQIKAKNLQASDSQLILSANPGCLAQIQAQLGKDYKVEHPISFLAQYLRSAND